MRKGVLAILVAIGIMGGVMLNSGNVNAATDVRVAEVQSNSGNSTKDALNSNEDASTGNSCGGVNTSIINCNEGSEQGGGIFAILLIVLNVLTFGIGIAGTVGIVIAGVMYLTARDNEAQVVKAKNMLVNIVIGLAAYALLWAFLQWIIPGGIIG